MKTGNIDFEAEKILNTKKYRDLDPATVLDVLKQEYARFKNKKQALENARTKLHRILADYLGMPPVEKFKEELSAAFSTGNREAVRTVCLEILKTHKSTSERIPILEEFYLYIFQRCSPVKILTDLASALNPFALPWMELPGDAEYHAYDINRQYVQFLNFFFSRQGMACLAEQRDVYVHPPGLVSDLTFFFKMYHCLEKRRRNAGLEVLKQIKSRWIALTFPTINLAKRTACIAANYEKDICCYAEDRGWHLERHKFATEELFLIRTEL